MWNESSIYPNVVQDTLKFDSKPIILQNVNRTFFWIGLLLME